jgi:phage gp36-like protein
MSYSTIASVSKKINQRTLVQLLNDEVRAEESVVTAGAFVVGMVYTITTIGTTNFVTIGAASNTIGVEFTATGAGTGTGTATTKIIDLTDAADLVVVRFTQAAAEAQAEVDPYLIGRYTLPFASTPTLITAISDEITIYNCYKRRGDIPENILNIYKANVKMLEKISSGMMDLGIADEPQNLSNEIKTNKDSDDRIFNDDLWGKY